jgi:universal stress protein E
MLSRGTILVVVERNDEALQVFTKACTLARVFGARIELYLCDAERGYALRHAYDQSGIGRAAEALVDEARRYLEALRRSVDVPDLDITIDASCETPLYQGIVQKVLLTGPDLVIKAVGGGNGGARPGPSLNDWHLTRTCPVPLLFMGRRAWRPVPRIAASIDPTDQETPGLARQIVASAAQFATACHGELDLLFGQARGEAGAPGSSGAAAALQALAGEFGLPQSRVHLLEGEPAQVLPAFVASQRFDLVALGALTHRQGVTGLVGTLTDALLQASDCDFLLLKPGTYARVAEPAAAPPGANA